MKKVALSVLGGRVLLFRKSPLLLFLLCLCVLTHLCIAHDKHIAHTDPPVISYLNKVMSPTIEQNYCSPVGQIKDACCDFQSVENMQRVILGKIQALVKTKFFRYYKLNLWQKCPFWNDDGLCMNEDCSVETIEESLLPKEWTQGALSAVRISPAGMTFQPFKVCTYKDQDFCLVEDQSDKNAAYVNLLDNPERFTGYSGMSASRVWGAIYNENCFDIVHKMTEGCQKCSNMLDPATNPLIIAEKMQQKAKEINPTSDHKPEDSEELDQFLSHLSEAAGVEEENEEMCLEKRVYYRLISGLHTSISLHICDEWFNQTSGEWGPNLECFVDRIGSHPERLENIYFTYALVLRAVAKAGIFLDGYQFKTGDPSEGQSIKAMVNDLINDASSCPTTFDEKTMFQGPDAKSLKLEFRDHFRNVSRIMDCVGCEKCRLWGKIQTTGLGTALKVLFSYEERQLNNPNLLQRSEIVALFNTLNRLSESLHAIQRFREMYLKQDQNIEAEVEVETEAETDVSCKEREYEDVLIVFLFLFLLLLHQINTNKKLSLVASKVKDGVWKTLSFIHPTCVNILSLFKQWGFPVPIYMEKIISSFE
ncbi:endoplasmic reticulum Oxidoreductin 1-domain-containing protein [Spinellus fusiger]|nr:endoplasmic reticulum Oxidoreductin 1-domain-containing protein [Spinellus fusiger]